MKDDAVVSVVLVMSMAGPVGGVPVYLDRPGIQDAADPDARVEKVGTAVVVGSAGKEHLDGACVRRGEMVGGDDPVLPEMP
jgi:hypothetical protein